MLRIEVRVCRQSCGRHAANNCWMSKPPAVGVGKNIDLNLSHAAGELVSQRSMMVVQTPQSLGIFHFQVLPFARRESGVIAIMRANYLDLIKVDDLVLRRLGIMLLCHNRLAH